VGGEADVSGDLGVEIACGVLLLLQWLLQHDEIKAWDTLVKQVERDRDYWHKSYVELQNAMLLLEEKRKAKP
jgi:hypothetical protein